MGSVAERLVPRAESFSLVESDHARAPVSRNERLSALRNARDRACLSHCEAAARRSAARVVPARGTRTRSSQTQPKSQSTTTRYAGSIRVGAGTDPMQSSSKCSPACRSRTTSYRRCGRWRLADRAHPHLLRAIDPPVEAADGLVITSQLRPDRGERHRDSFAERYREAVLERTPPRVLKSRYDAMHRERGARRDRIRRARR